MTFNLLVNYIVIGIVSRIVEQGWYTIVIAESSALDQSQIVTEDCCPKRDIGFGI